MIPCITNNKYHIYTKIIIVRQTFYYVKLSHALQKLSSFFSFSFFFLFLRWIGALDWARKFWLKNCQGIVIVLLVFGLFRSDLGVVIGIQTKTDNLFKLAKLANHFTHKVLSCKN